MLCIPYRTTKVPWMLMPSSIDQAKAQDNAPCASMSVSGLPVSEANRGPLKIDIACRTSCITCLDMLTSILGNAE